MLHPRRAGLTRLQASELPFPAPLQFQLIASSRRARWGRLLGDRVLPWDAWNHRLHINAQSGVSRSSEDQSQSDLRRNAAGLLTVLGVDQDILSDILRRDPELLMVPCEEVAAALLHLKLALPALDILELVKRKPSLLRDKNGVQVVERSIRDMEKLMPALPVQQRLLNGQMWLTFRERMQYWEQIDAVADKPPITYINMPGLS